MLNPMRLILSLTILSVVLLTSCSRKTVPAETTPVAASTGSATTNTTAPEVMPAPNTKAVSAREYSTGKRKVSGSTPNVIVVSDAKAKSTLDGKLYYDLGGHRYWKNNKDGKYYLDGIFTETKKKKRS